MNIEELIRPNILALEPYTCAQMEFGREDRGAIFLDANENPYDTGWNRYPDPLQRELRAVLADMMGVAPENVLPGNGSDEIIDMLTRSFCEPGRDNVVVFTPGYSMYEVNARINDAQVRRISLTEDFLPDPDTLAAVRDRRTKIIWLCTPNNPTGNSVPVEAIERICRENDSLVVVDEAYIDFADIPSMAPLVAQYPNLVVLRTMSKSWGAAGLRLGWCVADPRIIRVLDKVRLPYNISSAALSIALDILQDREGCERRIAAIRSERERMYGEFARHGIFSRVLPSEANFILATCPDAAGLYRYLLTNGVVVRLRDLPPLLPGGLRITIGTPAENDRVLELLGRWKMQTAVGGGRY